MAYGRSSQSSIFDTFTLSPLPYPVLFILLMVLLLMGFSWSFTYEEMIESAEDQMSWVLLATPIILLLAIRWLSTVESFDGSLFVWNSYNDRRGRGGYYGQPQEGSSPWGVAAAVVVLLIMVSYQSTIQDMWKH